MPFSAIKVISFDLDDTLFDNKPIIQRAENESRDFLEQAFNSQGIEFELSQLLTIRNQLIKDNQLGRLEQVYFFDDLGLLRKKVLEKFCQSLPEPATIAEQAFQVFLDFRQQIKIEPFVNDMLSSLAKNYHLVSISNGNSDPMKTSLAPFIQQHYSPELQLKAKPDPTMLNQALKDFNIEASQLLHVGDSLTTDGQAADRLGCPFYHLSPFQIKGQQEIIIEQFLRDLS